MRRERSGYLLVRSGRYCRNQCAGLTYGLLPGFADDGLAQLRLTHSPGDDFGRLENLASGQIGPGVAPGQIFALLARGWDRRKP